MSPAAQDLLLSMFCPRFASRRHGALIDLNSGDIKNKERERKKERKKVGEAITI